MIAVLSSHVRLLLAALLAALVSLAIPFVLQNLVDGPLSTGDGGQIWPAALAYFEDKQIIAAWCLLRQDFRSFRIDRIAAARIGNEGFGRRRAALMADWGRQNGLDAASGHDLSGGWAIPFG